MLIILIALPFSTVKESLNSSLSLQPPPHTSKRFQSYLHKIFSVKFCFHIKPYGLYILNSTSLCKIVYFLHSIDMHKGLHSWPKGSLLSYFQKLLLSLMATEALAPSKVKRDIQIQWRLSFACASTFGHWCW